MTNIIDKLKAAVSPDLTNMLTSHNQSSEAHADIREAIANAGGAIKDEDLYLKAGFRTNGYAFTINTTKKSFLLDQEHNMITETIYLNEPISGKRMESNFDIEDLYDSNDYIEFFQSEEEFKNKHLLSSFSELGFEEGSIDILFYSSLEPRE